jgi:hypothetical protein
MPATSCAPSSTPWAQRCTSIPTQPPISAAVLGGDRRVSGVEPAACIAAIRAAALEDRQGWRWPRTAGSDDATAAHRAAVRGSVRFQAAPTAASGLWRGAGSVRGSLTGTPGQTTAKPLGLVLNLIDRVLTEPSEKLGPGGWDGFPCLIQDADDVAGHW